jgi:hypothetical protein
MCGQDQVTFTWHINPTSGTDGKTINTFEMEKADNVSPPQLKLISLIELIKSVLIIFIF